MSFENRCQFKLPLTTTRSVLPLLQIPVQTIIEPPLDLSCNTRWGISLTGTSSYLYSAVIVVKVVSGLVTEHNHTPLGTSPTTMNQCQLAPHHPLLPSQGLMYQRATCPQIPNCLVWHINVCSSFKLFT